jgi:hypothetical protein
MIDHRKDSECKPSEQVAEKSGYTRIRKWGVPPLVSLLGMKVLDPVLESHTFSRNFDALVLDLYASVGQSE